MIEGSSRSCHQGLTQFDFTRTICSPISNWGLTAGSLSKHSLQIFGINRDVCQLWSTISSLIYTLVEQVDFSCWNTSTFFLEVLLTWCTSRLRPRSTRNWHVKSSSSWFALIISHRHLWARSFLTFYWVSLCANRRIIHGDTRTLRLINAATFLDSRLVRLLFRTRHAEIGAKLFDQHSRFDSHFAYRRKGPHKVIFGIICVNWSSFRFLYIFDGANLAHTICTHFTLLRIWLTVLF